MVKRRLTCYRRQAWLWQEGDIYRSRSDQYKVVPRIGMVDDLGVMPRRSPMIRRSVLKSRQDFDLEDDDDRVNIYSALCSYCVVYH